MALELRDFRGKITDETYLALQADSRAFERDMADIAREVLHEWAVKKLHAAKVLYSLARDQGLIGASKGVDAK
jgi:hypothetical protein